MTDMEKIIEKANSAGFRVMEDARYGKPDECVDWEGVFDRVAETILTTLAAEMAAAGKKVAGPVCTEAQARRASANCDMPDADLGWAWTYFHDAATCELQAALKGEGEA